MRSIIILCIFTIFVSSTIGKQYYVQNKYLNWHAAHQYCASHGLQFATVTTPNEQKSLERAITKAKLSNVANVGVWIGASDLAETGKYVWVSTGEPFIYNHWLPTQPDNNNNEEHCAHIYPASRNTFEWNDGPCHHGKFFVCEEQPKNCYKNVDINVVCEIINRRR